MICGYHKSGPEIFPKSIIQALDLLQWKAIKDRTKVLSKKVLSESE